MAKRVLVVDDVRLFQESEDYTITHVRSARAAQRALEETYQVSGFEYDELWLDYDLSWNNSDPTFDNGERVAAILRHYASDELVVRVISDLGEVYIRKITRHLDASDIEYTLNPNGEGLTPHERTH